MESRALDRLLAHPGAGELGGRDLVSLRPEEQHSDYEAAVAILGAEAWRVRRARITPTKPGAFVAVWRRARDGSTQPFDVDDPTAGLIVLVEDDQQFGCFRFTTAHLDDLGVVRSARQPGKRGFRVYPAWCSGLNTQAARTQRAQAPAFTDLSPLG